MSTCGPLSAIADPRRLIAKLLEWYRAEHRDLPWRRERDPYQIWLSEIMLQQTRVEVVLPYFERFLRKYPRIEDLARADEEAVLTLWSGLGYYNRARNLRRAAAIVCEKYGGRFPSDYEDALALPGIGRYTAGAILSIAYGRPLPILDGNIRRLLARLLALKEPVERLDRKLWPILAELVQEPPASAHASEFNQSLMELGALICLPRNPRCRRCPLASQCQAHRSGIENDLPVPRSSRSAEELSFTVAAIDREGEWLFRAGHEDGFLEGFWELPRIPGTPGSSSEAEFEKRLGLDLRLLAGFPPVRHQITYRKLHYHPFRAVLLSAPRGTGWRWARPEEPDLPVASYTKKILRRAQEPCTQRSFRYNSADETG